jgi:hypothetical protein
MENLIRTLLYDVFAAPHLGLLHSAFEFSTATCGLLTAFALMSIGRTTAEIIDSHKVKEDEPCVGIGKSWES